MPSKSQKQHDFMVIACKDAEFAEKNGIQQEVACHFIAEDKDKGLWQKSPKLDKKIYYKW